MVRLSQTWRKSNDFNGSRFSLRTADRWSIVAAAAGASRPRFLASGYRSIYWTLRADGRWRRRETVGAKRGRNPGEVSDKMWAVACSSTGIQVATAAVV